MATMTQDELLENENIEIELILEAIYLKHGFDFRQYGRSHLKRRLQRRKSISKFTSFTDILRAVIYEPDFFKKVFHDLSINVTEMFRDPFFYQALRRDMVPILQTYPFLRIWHAGCATGEEVYSTAILLKESGLYDRAEIYATDFNEQVLAKAKEGKYTIENIKEYTTNYQNFGGGESFADYYAARNGSVIIDESLKKNIVFSAHNLVTDGVFGEMNLIMCRNVLIYFNRPLQDRVVNVFSESLCREGFLCLGSKESLRFSAHHDKFNVFSENEKIYRKTA